MAVFKVAAAVVGLGLLVVFPAGATTTKVSPAPPLSTRLAEGAAARAPLGFVELCRTSPQMCTSEPRTGRARVRRLDETSWSDLVRVHRLINRRIRPLADGAGDIWSLDPLSGDCEDYALTKQSALIKSGWPRSALLLAVVRDERGGSHAVLVARTDRGDFVLDNREAEVRPWSALPYLWIKLQSAADANGWVRLAGYDQEMIARKRERLERLIERAGAGAEPGWPTASPAMVGSPATR